MTAKVKTTDAVIAGAAQAIAAAAAKERAGQAHGAVASAVLEAVAHARRTAFSGDGRGDKVAKRLTLAVDTVVVALADVAGADTAGVAVVAVGGYGRSELAPYSDIDFVVLQRETDDDACKPFLDRFLYPLWDAKLKAGYAVHTPVSAATFAQEDMVARTAFLDARFLYGDRALFDDFQKRYERLRKKTKTAFVKAKLLEQDARQAKAGETRYVTEPDVKDGKGGLRDLQTIRWIYKYVYRASADDKSWMGTVFDASAQRDLRKAERFLWSVRAHLHDLRGRADDQLTFETQPEIAARLGYADRLGMSAAERLMRHYFVTAIEVGRLTRILCAKLEEERAKRLPHMPKLLPRVLMADEAQGKPNIKLNHGRLDFASAARARKQPRDLFRLFRAFSKKPEIDFHPDALALVAREARAVTREVRKDASIARLFLAILADSEDPERTLRIMSEAGLLGKYIPAFGALIGRIEYGLFRPFTVDEHVMRAVAHIHSMHKGDFGRDHPISAGILRDTDDLESFYFAVLMHQAEWSLKDSAPDAVERLVARVAKRLGFDRERGKVIAWACAHHQLMVRTVERRNIAELRTLVTFAGAVGDKARLDMLVVLSTCYLRSVGYSVWDGFSRQRLIELYNGASAWIEGGEPALAKLVDTRIGAARRALEKKLQSWDADDRDAFLARLSGAFLQYGDTEMMARIAELVRAAERDDVPAAVQITPRNLGLEAIVYADDRIGLLGDLAAAIAREGVSVRALQAMAFSDEKAIDVFILQPSDDQPIDEPGKTQAIHAALLAAAKAPPKAARAFSRRFGDRRELFSIAPVVRVDETASDLSVVVEAEGLDRPGLVHDLASALARLDLTIASAHIATYGERAVDTFYVNDSDGKKASGAARLQEIEKTLIDVLSAGDGA